MTLSFLDDTMERFGEKLRTLRMQRGLTMRQLADALEIKSTGYIADLETGKKKPSTTILLKVSRVFNVCADQLLKDKLDLD